MLQKSGVFLPTLCFVQLILMHGFYLVSFIQFANAKYSDSLPALKNIYTLQIIFKLYR